MFQKKYKEKIFSKNISKSLRTLPESKEKVNLDFSSNDYLGLSQDSQVLTAGIKAASEYGNGSTGSRLLSGNYVLFKKLENDIARDKKTAAALIFNSGFQCNISVLSSLLDQKTLANQPLVFFDRLNHSSLYQAIFLSGAKLIRYKHNDWQDLAKLMMQYQDDNRPKFIVTETVFGMDGDIAPIDEIVRLAREYHAFLYLDEAHATGIIGNAGYGLSTTVDLSDIPSVIMGTFSKALGSSGAYIACSKDIKDYIVNFCPGFIYSTANAPFSIGAAAKAWQILPNMHKEREKLKKNSMFFKEHCQSLGLNIGNTATNIIPIILDTEEKTCQITALLRSHGIKVSCIRPPTVPPGSSRIRIAINVNHSKEDIKKLISALKCINK